MKYPGGKNREGVYQTIINQMPPHTVYVEAFAGSGAVLRHKRRAPSSIVIDVDAAACNGLREIIHTKGFAGSSLTVIEGDALDYLRGYDFHGVELIYCDPPYLMSTRSCKRPLYAHDFSEDAQHYELLNLLRTINAQIILSGYSSELYDRMLPDWRRVSFRTTTHRGDPTEEVLWMNYPVPLKLHDYRYLGANFRDRERLKRKKQRWARKLLAMPALERYAMLSVLEEIA